MTFRDFLNEAKESKIPKLPSDIKSSYLNKKEVIDYKSFELTDEGSKMGGNVWMGVSGKGVNIQKTIIFSSFDMGTPTKIKSFKNPSDAEAVFVKFKDGISYDEILKILK